MKTDTRSAANYSGAGAVPIEIPEQETSSRMIGRGLDIGRSAVLTLKDAAAYLGISKAHLSNVINRKVPGLPQLRCARIGRRILIRREWADEFLDRAGQKSVFDKW
jgi:excisionase family DNA binding protein